MSKKFSIRYLIDVAIGNPVAGIVNFNALYTVLQAITEKLDLEDEEIEVDSSFCPAATNTFDSKSNVSSERLMEHQVYDILAVPYKNEEKPLILQSTSKEKENKKAHRFVLLQDQQIAEDRKVAFGQAETKNDDEKILTPHESKKSTSLDIRQQIDCLYDRLDKIENVAIWTVDTKQSIECLDQTIQLLQSKIYLLERSVSELRDKRYAQEKDIIACRIKLEHDKLAVATNDLRNELNVLKKSIVGGGNKNVPMDLLSESSHDSTEIKRLENQIIELKQNVCILTQKVANLEEYKAKTDGRSSVEALELFQHEILILKDQIESTTLQIKQQVLGELANKFNEVNKSKIDREEVEELLSEKADYSMLHQKVSLEYMRSEHHKFEKQLAEITNCVMINEEQIQNQIVGIKKLVGDENINDMLNVFKLKFNTEIQRVSNDIKKLSEIKPDNDSAITRLKDLTCLSCDQNVVMKTIEINNLPKFKDSYVSKTIGSSITFEVGKLRQAGKVGLFYDDYLLELEKNNRHSGGVHTIVTNKDRILKTRLYKSK